MSNNEINVLIEYEFDRLPSKTWFENISVRILDCINSKESVELSIVITDNEKIQQLNKKYMDEDEPTDVLSFAMIDEGGVNASANFIMPPDGLRHLGEVIISYQKALEQSQEQGHNVIHELIILLIHGILHLFGYNHEEPDEMAIMQAKESEITDILYTT